MSNKDQPTGKGPIVASNKSKNTENKDVSTEVKDPADNKPDDVAAEASTPARGSSGGGSGLAVLALLLSLAVAGVGYLFWQEVGEKHRQMAQRMDQVDKSVVPAANLVDRLATLESRLSRVEGHLPTDLAAQLTGLEQAIDSLRGQLDQPAAQSIDPVRLTALEERLDVLAAKVQSGQSTHAETLASLTAAIDELKAGLQGLSQGLAQVQAEQGRTKDRLAAAEAAFLLRIANEALVLRQDTRTAAEALAATEKALADTAAADSVRQTVAEARAGLSDVATPDIAALAGRLMTLEGKIATLPQPSTEPRPSTVARLDITNAGAIESVKTVLSDIWSSLRTLVTIRRQGAEDAPLRAPEQQRFLVENVRLQLASARLALLRADEATYHASLATSMQWLNDYFDTGDAAVTAVIDAIESLDGEKIRPAVPDLGPVIDAVKQLQLSRAHNDISPVSAMGVWS